MKPLLALLTLALPLCAQATWHVDASASAPFLGTATQPFATIQSAIDASSPGDTILVGAGLYREQLDFSGKALQLRSTHGADVTTIDGQRLGTVIRIASGEIGALVEGFTITGGQGAATDVPGGLDLRSSTVRVRSCVIRDHLGGHGGPALPIGFFNVPGTVAGVFVDQATAFFEDCSFIGNQGGNGANADPGRPSSGGGPGAMEILSGSVTLERCRLVDNSGGRGGAGEFLNCAGSAGAPGGIEVHAGASLVSRGSLWARNAGGNGGREGYFSCVTGRAGAGALLVFGDADLIGDTLVSNSGGLEGQGSFASWPPFGAIAVFGDLEVHNAILHANQANQITPVTAFGITPSVTVSHSNVEGGYPGSGNLDVDPAFIDPAGDDWSLAPDSPCIDMGDTSLVTPGSRDLDGDPRIYGGRVDIGADEAILSVSLDQPGGPGSPVIVRNHLLTPGHEFFNVISLDPCAGPPGSGPDFGLCIRTPQNVQFIRAQLMTPLGTAPFHFVAAVREPSFGPYALPPMTVELLCVDVTSGLVSSIQRATIR